MGYIYMITNKVNGKKYIGKTYKHVEKRFKQHIKLSLSKSDNSLLHKAMRKYGINNFEVKTLLKDIDNSKLSYYERLWIKKLDTIVDHNKGYNLTIGGEGIIGYKFTDSQKEKVSISSKEMWKHFKEKGIKCLSRVNRESIEKRSLNKEWKKHISESRTGRFKGIENPFYGKHHSQSTRDIISKVNTKYSIDMYSRNNELLKHFKNSCEAKEWLVKNNYTRNKNAESLILKVCSGFIESDGSIHLTAYGFKWKYSSVETKPDECKVVD